MKPFQSKLLQLSLLFLVIDISEQFQHTFGLRRHTIVNGNIFQQANYRSSARKLAEQGNTSNHKKAPNRKKKKIVINQNLVGVNSISSDGRLTEQKEKQREAQKARDAVKSNLGVKSKKKKKTSDKSNQKLSKKAQQLAAQRTGNGSVDGKLQAGLALPEDQKIEIQEIKRGNKQVTVVRGFTCAMDERKKILKEIKKKIGGGGSLIDGIIEVQGAHSDVIMKNLKSKGYSQTRKL